MTKQKFFNLISWIFLGAVLIYFAYAKGWIFAEFESISPKQAHEMLKSDKNVFLLDVRTPEEYSQEFIEGSTLIPVQVLAENLSKIEQEKNHTIIVYCHSGNRSVKASRILHEHGFTPLNLQGGITQWKSEGFPTLQ